MIIFSRAQKYAGMLLIAAILVTGLLLTSSIMQRVMAQGTSGFASFVCTPLNVGAFPGSATLAGGRIHVQCVEVQNETIAFFALAIQDASSQHLLSLMESAVVAGKQLRVFYNLDSSQNPLGCIVQDCRRIEGVYLLP